MANHEHNTEELIRRAADHDREATELLLDRHRQRLRRMIAVRFDHRINSRLDPSDVVQGVLIKAMKKLPEYVKEKPIAFYPWLRQLAWEQMVDIFRTHVLAQKRSVDREANPHPVTVPLPDQSAILLADVLVARQSSPSQRIQKQQMKEQVQNALNKISGTYREVLIMRYLEELSMHEIADCMGASENAIKMRHMRALQQLGKELSQPGLSNG